jgi:hypothetical protein
VEQQWDDPLGALAWMVQHATSLRSPNVRWIGYLSYDLGRLFGRHHATYFIAAIGIAWACFILAMVALYYLARLDLPRRQAERAVLLTTIFPFAFFFGVAYSESTFLLFAVLSFYGFRTRRWLLGGLCGAVAATASGILILPPLAWVAHGRGRPHRSRRAANRPRGRAGRARSDLARPPCCTPRAASARTASSSIG